MTKLLAFALVFLMLASLFSPFASAASASAPEVTGAEAVSELLEFSAQLHEMTARFKESAAKGAPGEPYNTARLIVKDSEKPDTRGSLGFVEGFHDRWVIQYSSPEEAMEAAGRLSRAMGLIASF